jgi:RNA polymerase sigma factor (sigma-70 family)
VIPTGTQVHAYEAPAATGVRFLLDHGDDALLGPSDERRLARAMAAGDRHARDALIEGNLRLVVAIARRYQGLGLSLDDLVQEGAVGLAAAADRYEWRPDARFATYASWWIKQAILRALTEQSRTIRLPHHVVANQIVLRRVRATLAARFGRPPTDAEVAAETGLRRAAIEAADDAPEIAASLNDPLASRDPDRIAEPLDFLEDESAADPVDRAIADNDVDRLHSALLSLRAREREIVERHFGLDHDPETLEAISADLGVTRERVRQLEQHALAALGRRLSRAS